MQLIAYYFSLLLVLILFGTATSKLKSTTNIENNLVTTRNEYILNHILQRPILFSKTPNKKSEITEPEMKEDNINKVELLKNHSTLQIQKEYNVNDPNEFLDENDDTDGFLSRQKTFVDFYHEGVLAYLANDWLACISLLERAVVLYQDYYNALTYCRGSCDLEKRTFTPSFPENYENHHFYESILQKTLCIEKCRREHLTSVSKFFTLDYDDKVVFKTRKPYNYLQICYYRDHEISKAINAAFTALIGDPEDKMLQKNIKYYASLKEFEYENMKDLEDKEFSRYYLRGVAEYNLKNWTGAIENMEKFIQLWIQEYDKCRAFCENDFYQGWLPDFTTAVANHYVYVLRCKQNCTDDLSIANGRRYGDIFANAYDYLQYSYYQVDDIRSGAKCVSSYLALYPVSTEMLDSFRYYKALPNVTALYFQSREEAKRIAFLRKYEKVLIDFVDKEFSDLLLTEDDTFRQSSVQSDLFESKKVQDETKELYDINDVAQNNSTFFNIIKTFILKWKKDKSD